MFLHAALRRNFQVRSDATLPLADGRWMSAGDGRVSASRLKDDLGVWQHTGMAALIPARGHLGSQTQPFAVKGPQERSNDRHATKNFFWGVLTFP